MKIKEIDFGSKDNIHDVLDVLYQELNSMIGSVAISRGTREKTVWDAYYDDVFGVLSDEDFIKKYGNDLKFSLIGLQKFKENEPENYKKFLEWVLDYQVEELPNHSIKFSYEVI